MRRCATMALDDPKVLVRYHDVLLFLLAYPEDAQLHAEAERELHRVAAAAKVLHGRSERARRTLDDSGIAWSQTTYAFSYPVVRWLAERHPSVAEIADSTEIEPLKRLLRVCLPAMEYELVGERAVAIGELFSDAKGDGAQTNVSWLVQQLERLACDAPVRERLFDDTEPYITLTPKDAPLSRTFARGLPAPLFFHRQGLQRAFDLQKLIAMPLPPRRRLSLHDRRHLIDTARGVLAMLGRETDVITLAAEAATESFDLERGISIALYSMPPQRRFPLDTHVGMMVFKNGVPAAYGGGWPFLGTCKIGVNVFPAFRGGESSLLFAQVLRVYQQRFAAQRFLVEPYQIGEGNPEGVRSGAFWFYYRLGFRPLGKRHAELARAEFERIGRDRSYRSPLNVMRRLSHADMELPISPSSGARNDWSDPAHLSLAVSGWIGREFSGDRARAQRAARRRVVRALDIRDAARWTPAERFALDSLSLLLAMIPDL
ncbi:MAG: hypothetical protein JO043_08665, partial [Candidatus Eremiobacteraeota bacterium]|nr:hypothetical protein [Candidatus Eremiobacteraeota bacterium]